MSAVFTDFSLLIGLLLVVEQVAKLACDLTRPAPMSGGFVVKDSSEGGASPGLHKRGTPRAEDRGDPRRCRRESLTALGAASPLFSPNNSATERSDGVASGMCRVRSSHAGTHAGPSVSGARSSPAPEGRRPMTILERARSTVF